MLQKEYSVTNVLLAYQQSLSPGHCLNYSEAGIVLANKTHGIRGGIKKF